MPNRYATLLEESSKTTAQASEPSAASPSSPASPAPPVPRREQVLPEAKEGGKEVERERGFESSQEGGSPANEFDINERPWRKGSFLLTNKEFWGFDQLKIDLEKDFDLSATKDDLARCAFHLLIGDYQRRGDASFLVTMLRQKTRK